MSVCNVCYGKRSHYSIAGEGIIAEAKQGSTSHPCTSGNRIRKSSTPIIKNKKYNMYATDLTVLFISK